MQLKKKITEALWQETARHPSILSATLTGSFANSESLAGLSDIDFVVVVDKLNRTTFESICEGFKSTMLPVFQDAGYDFRLNATLGPLKFNAPKLAVLHLMLYSREGHVDHVIQSPFTCLDWQRSTQHTQASLADVYPTFGLQPRHFLSARRSISDYLKDYRARVVSYRELICGEDGYHEEKKSKPMDLRDKHEFAYHVMRFLMLNLLKLVEGPETFEPDLTKLMDRFFRLFPSGEAEHRPLLLDLADKKRRIDFVDAIEDLDTRLEHFVQQFEQQFRTAFVDDVGRHILFRHATTEMNQGATRFVGRSDPAILPVASDDPWQSLLRSKLDCARPQRAIVSPLKRCRESLRTVWDGSCAEIEQRLIEINYGDCESLTVSEAQEQFPELFAAWQNGQDDRFPGGGENTQDVTLRAEEFIAHALQHGQLDSVICSHNVLLRSIVGKALHLPMNQWYRLRIPHLAPIELVATREFGWYLNLDPDVEKAMFANFQGKFESTNVQPDQSHSRTAA